MARRGDGIYAARPGGDFTHEGKRHVARLGNRIGTRRKGVRASKATASISPGTLCCSLLGDGLGGPSSHRALPLRRRVAEVRSELTEHRDEFRSSGLDGLKRLLDLWIQTHGWRLSFGPSLSSAWE